MLRLLILFASCLGTAAGAAGPALPAVNLVVEVRVVDEAATTGRGDFTVSTRALAPPLAEALQLQLLNGQTGAVRLARALPVQWLQAAGRGAASSAASAPERAGAVAHALSWVPSGQSLTVRPQWAGGSSPVTMDLHFSSTALQSAPGAPGAALPATRTRQAGTSLQLPLGVWVSFAATGTVQSAEETRRAATAGTLTLAERGRQLMQVRVSLP